MSDLLRSLTKISKLLAFFNESLIRSFFRKNERFTQRTNEQIPNPATKRNMYNRELTLRTCKKCIAGKVHWKKWGFEKVICCSGEYFPPNIEKGILYGIYPWVFRYPNTTCDLIHTMAGVVNWCTQLLPQCLGSSECVRYRTKSSVENVGLY